MNVICVAGQLGRDAEVRFLPDGTAVAGFSVADDQGQNKPTIWHNCSIFGKRAESLAQYLVKGQKVTVTGNITEREYTNKDGVKAIGRDIRVNDIALQGSKMAAEDHTEPAAKPQRKASTRNAAPDVDPFANEDIPF
jgi:single-strand DNA-binding protein